MSYFIICDCTLIITPREVVLAADSGDDGRTCGQCNAPIRAFRTTQAPDLTLSANGVLSAGVTLEPVTLEVHDGEGNPMVPANGKPL
jgi:hypothetical protein